MLNHYFLKTYLIAYLIFICKLNYAQVPTKPYEETQDTITAHIPGSGFLIAQSKIASLRFSQFVSVRYLNQSGLNASYTDYFGRTFELKKRNDLQFQKVMLYFNGWLAKPQLRYMLYVWTSNTQIGLGAQVVIAGNLQYKINKYLDLGVGIGGIPTNRTLWGSWPNWHKQDCRTMADEFFRGSFTTGIWAQGELVEGLYYKTMLGNNLSQMGIDAGQLDDKFDTWGSALWWTRNNYGRTQTNGDFEKHQKVATLLGVAYTRSSESKQSQANTNAPENSQIRLSDGTNLFALNALNDGSQINNLNFQMASSCVGVKYNGFALDAEVYLRKLNNIKATKTIGIDKLIDKGISLQASTMIIDKTLQLFVTGSRINGNYGKPWELSSGINYYPFKSKFFRLNAEIIHVKNSPVGYLSYPTLVGSNGNTFMLNMEWFY